MSQPIPNNNQNSQLDYDPLSFNSENNGHDSHCYGPDENNECDCGLSQGLKEQLKQVRENVEQTQQCDEI